MTTSPSKERLYPSPVPGLPMLVLAVLLIPFAVWMFVRAGQVGASERAASGLGVGTYVAIGIAALVAFVLVVRGLVLIQPNHSRVVLLFGRYRGTLRRDGLYWINPFTSRRAVSLRAHNFNSDKLKVNDKSGNPIEIGAVVVWRVLDTARAVFDVENHESYVEVQTESAVRALAAAHAYDPIDVEADETSLRGSADIVNDELRTELTERLVMAGIDVLECRLTHLAYAPEIASAMLQRQQADAIIAARTRIVDGAVGMVEMALERLEQRGVVALDEERKAAMVSNLLVVLCSERGTTPVVNAGTLYTG